MPGRHRERGRFRRTIVGLKRTPEPPAVGFRVVSDEPSLSKKTGRWPDRSGCWFQMNLIGLKHDGLEHDGCRDVLQMNSREIEETQVWVFSPSRPCFRRILEGRSIQTLEQVPSRDDFAPHQLIPGVLDQFGLPLGADPEAAVRRCRHAEEDTPRLPAAVLQHPRRPAVVHRAAEDAGGAGAAGAYRQP